MQGENRVSTFVLNDTQRSLSNGTLNPNRPEVDASTRSYGPEEFLIKKSSADGGHRIIQGPHMSIMQLLLALLYVAIIWDILFILSSLYFPYWLQRGTKVDKGGSRRNQHSLAVTTGRTFTQRRSAGKMTLDFLWKRIMAEARRLQRADIQHRTITQAMMQTRLEARSQLERDRSLNKTSNNYMSRRLSTVVKDQKIDMVRWAARISSDHDPRAKK